MASSSFPQHKGAGTGETISSTSSVEVFPGEAGSSRVLLEDERAKLASLEEQILVLEASVGRHKQLAEEAAVLSDENAATRRKIAAANDNLRLEQDMGLRMQRERQEALKHLRQDLDKQKTASCELEAQHGELHGNCEMLQAQWQSLALRAEALAEERGALELASEHQASKGSDRSVDAESEAALAMAEKAQRNITKARQEEATACAKLEAERSLGLSARKATLEAQCSAKLTELETCVAVERQDATEINNNVEAILLEVSEHKLGIDRSDDLVREFSRSGQESLMDDKEARIKLDAQRKELAAANERTGALQQQQKVSQESRDAWRQGTAAVVTVLVAVVAVTFLMAKGATPEAYE